MMMQDAKIMANELIRKAANYTINQVEILEKYPQGWFSGNIQQSL
ncbi:MAG: hypothetical protein ACLVEU_13665 [Bacteroides cellulosilyticus]